MTERERIGRWGAEALHLMAGYDPVRPVWPRQLARALWGDHAVRRVPRRHLRNPSALLAIDGRWYIYVREDIFGLSPHKFGQL
jgi:hypothetical protein